MPTTLDSALLIHRTMIRRKPWLKKTYKKFYEEFARVEVPPGKKVELGSGAGFLKECIPEVITSDVIPGPEIDRVFSATKMPFTDASVSAFFMVDVLHHIKEPKTALKEMERCLKPKGRIVMIEPYNSPFGRFMNQTFHRDELFDPDAGWRIAGTDRLRDANGAIPWIIFVRDRKKYERLFPNLTIVRLEPHTALSYIFSGGMSRPQFLPTWAYPIVSGIETALRPFSNLLALFVTIELEKV